MPLNVPRRKKGKKAMQVTWSDSESCQSSEKKSNAVEFGWSPPKVLDREGRPTNVIKLKLE